MSTALGSIWCFLKCADTVLFCFLKYVLEPCLDEKSDSSISKKTKPNPLDFEKCLKRKLLPERFYGGRAHNELGVRHSGGTSTGISWMLIVGIVL